MISASKQWTAGLLYIIDDNCLLSFLSVILLFCLHHNVLVCFKDIFVQVQPTPCFPLP